jgi:hypothetical protein
LQGGMKGQLKNNLCTKALLSGTAENLLVV